MRTILFPERVAVIGASRREESIGALVMRNILAAGFQGELYPIHRVAEQIQGLKAYPSIHDVPEPVDLAVVVVPAAQAIDVVKDCGKAGVKALLVLSAGFAEAGEEGVRLQEKLRRRVRRAGMRVVGPNSFGLINNDPAVRLNATLASVIPRVRSARPLRAERRARRRGARVGRPTGPRHLRLRLRRQPCRRLGQRPHAVLDRRPGDRHRRSLPGVDGQPPQVLPHRPGARVGQARRRRELGRLELRRPARSPDSRHQRAARRRSTPCCDRPASSASRTSTSSSTSRS